MNEPMFTRQRLFPGFDGKMCKINPIIMSDGSTQVLTYTMLLLSGSDVFYDTFSAISRDGGRTFGEPRPLTSGDKVENGVRSHYSISSTFYHRSTGKWLIFGVELFYSDDNHPIIHGDGIGIAVSQPFMTTYDPETQDWSLDFQPLPLPFECVSACPFGQIMEDADGTLLLSFYLARPEDSKASALTVRYALGKDGLAIVKAGEMLISGPDHSRGYCEPSVARLHGRYYMTIRTDEVGLLSESEDGYIFSEPTPWTWDDGEILENYNTMQRWVRFEDRLYLCYTRRDALNGHVFRHRAPVYMAPFDEEHRCLIRAEEVILVPELGARLGNFSVLDVNEHEALLSTAEWMQPLGCEKYGSDNSIWLIRIKDC